MVACGDDRVSVSPDASPRDGSMADGPSMETGKHVIRQRGSHQGYAGPSTPNDEWCGPADASRLLSRVRTRTKPGRSKLASTPSKFFHWGYGVVRMTPTHRQCCQLGNVLWHISPSNS